MKNLVLVTLALFAPSLYAQDRVTQYDFDKDGKVSFEDLNQFCNVSKTLFERADKNSDNYLSNSEMRTAKGYLFSSCEEVQVARTPIDLQDSYN